MSELESYLDALRRIADATKKPFISKTQHVAYRIATQTLKQWGRMK